MPSEKPFCASSCFSIIICSLALCALQFFALFEWSNFLDSPLFFFSPRLWTIRIFWRKLECENHLTPSTSRAYWGGTSSLQTDQRYRSPHTPTRTRSHFRDYVADFQSFSLWNVIEFQMESILSNVFMTRHQKLCNLCPINWFFRLHTVTAPLQWISNEWCNFSKKAKNLSIKQKYYS